MSSRKLAIAVITVAGSLLVAPFAPRAARACGGCFAPQEQVSVVTDHRMVVSLSQEQTTLWDQFVYSGRAEDFVWVLPVASPDTRVELASSDFFDLLESDTAPIIQGPIQYGGGGGGSGGGFGCGMAASESASAGGAARDEVTVHSMATVGPYETSTISSESPMALVEWLQAHGYTVPDAIQPTIDHYVSQHMAFVALRLRPGEGVQAMQPVRVTFPGMSTTFPLRMVSAGVADKVGLTLWVFGEGRYEPSNFESAQIDRSRLVWLTTDNRSNYRELFAQTIADRGGRAWITESAVDGNEISYLLSSGPTTAADYQVATRGIRGLPIVTRLRTSLAAAALDDDLTLQAVPIDQPDRISRTYQATQTSSSSGLPAFPILILGALVTARQLARRRRTG